MALPSLRQHLNVLEKSGLIRTRKNGRVRMRDRAPAALGTAQHWIAAQRRVWEDCLDRLDGYQEDAVR